MATATALAIKLNKVSALVDELTKRVEALERHNIQTPPVKRKRPQKAA